MSGEVTQEAIRFSAGSFLLHGHVLNNLLHTLNTFLLFCRTRSIHIQEHETPALEPAPLMLLLPFHTSRD